MLVDDPLQDVRGIGEGIDVVDLAVLDQGRDPPNVRRHRRVRRGAHSYDRA